MQSKLSSPNPKGDQKAQQQKHEEVDCLDGEIVSAAIGIVPLVVVVVVVPVVVLLVLALLPALLLVAWAFLSRIPAPIVVHQHQTSIAAHGDGDISFSMCLWLHQVSVFTCEGPFPEHRPVRL